VKAGIKAKEIVIVGIVQGDVEATEKIEIRKDAKLVGNIKTARIAIEDGAVFKGSIDIVRTEAPKAAPRPVQAAPVEKPQPAQQSIAASAGGGATEAKRDRS
jgi:cytoskeletal protein CcmA (bactofilin family)